MKNFIFGILFCVVVSGLLFGAYSFGKKSSLNNSPPPIATPLPTTQPSPEVKSEKVDDSELIRQALFRKNNWADNNDIRFKLSTNDGDYASGSVSSNGSGGYFYAAKVDQTWRIVADGNGMIDCDQLTDYQNFPKTLIPSCYVKATGTIIKR